MYPEQDQPPPDVALKAKLDAAMATVRKLWREKSNALARVRRAKKNMKALLEELKAKNLINEELYDKLECYSEFVVRRTLKKLSCDVCRASLLMDAESASKDQSYHLLTLKNNGGLVIPSAGTVKVVRAAEWVVRQAVADSRRSQPIKLLEVLYMNGNLRQIYIIHEFTHVFNNVNISNKLNCTISCLMYLINIDIITVCVCVWVYLVLYLSSLLNILFS
ncbi:uncharacterized protein LOC119220563 isoform X1 [Pungitius pungitius]|uniref:uncharacterized protein LOC119220563 isoform X1 n=1 Tax=Pungitius pungitius TaxID=134920 RepID=UPI002E0F5B69